MNVRSGSKVEYLSSRQRFGGWLRSLVVDIVYPKICAGCGARGTWLCSWCAFTVPVLNEPLCGRCGMPKLHGHDCWCGNMHSALRQARSLYPYTGWTAEAVKRLKYSDEFDRASQIGPLMSPLTAELGRIDALVPVPLHESRLASRGFNQSELLAEQISDLTGIPVKPMLVRTVATSAQVSLSLDDRRDNVRDAFSVASGWVPSPSDRLLLVDDVRTTGATLNACAVTLVLAGAGSVSAITFALDLQRRELDALIARG